MILDLRERLFSFTNLDSLLLRLFLKVLNQIDETQDFLRVRLHIYNSRSPILLVAFDPSPFSSEDITLKVPIRLLYTKPPLEFG